MKLLVVVALLASCKGESTSHTNVATEKCFADEIGTLRSTWQVREGCTTGSSQCRDACVSGDGDSCFNLAIDLQSHNAEDKQPLVSDYFKRACSLGVAPGCTNWAAALLDDEGATKAFACTYRVFEKACAVGEPFGCGMTARLLIEAPRMPLDPWIGYNQLTRACEELGGPPCHFLALYIERGTFGPPDQRRITQLMERACDTGEDEACGQTKPSALMRGDPDEPSASADGESSPDAAKASGSDELLK